MAAHRLVHDPRTSTRFPQERAVGPVRRSLADRYAIARRTAFDHLREVRRFAVVRRACHCLFDMPPRRRSAPTPCSRTGSADPCEATRHSRPPREKSAELPWFPRCRHDASHPFRVFLVPILRDVSDPPTGASRALRDRRVNHRDRTGVRLVSIELPVDLVDRRVAEPEDGRMIRASPIASPPTNRMKSIRVRIASLSPRSLGLYHCASTSGRITASGPRADRTLLALGATSFRSSDAASEAGCPRRAGPRAYM